MKAKSSVYLFFFSLLLAATLGGCAATKMSSDNLQAVKTLQPPAGKALVYVVRPQGLGFFLHFTVICDDKKIGAISAQRFVYAFVDPGPHTFVTHAENKAELAVTLEAGHTYFIQQQLSMGMAYAENKLLLLSETEGRKKLAKCELSPDCPAYTAAK